MIDSVVDCGAFLRLCLSFFLSTMVIFLYRWVLSLLYVDSCV